MEGKAFGRITRGERCRGQRHAVSISLVPEIRMSSVERARAQEWKWIGRGKSRCAETNLPNERCTHVHFRKHLNVWDGFMACLHASRLRRMLLVWIKQGERRGNITLKRSYNLPGPVGRFCLHLTAWFFLTSMRKRKSGRASETFFIADFLSRDKVSQLKKKGG